MPIIWLRIFVVLPFVLLGMVTLVVPGPESARYVKVVLSSGLCLVTVSLLIHAGFL
jgi:hypothetical protein